MADGLSQESAMQRLGKICVMFVLIAQGVWAEGQIVSGSSEWDTEAEGPMAEPETVDISGHWDGEIYQSSQTFIYSLNLTQTGSEVSGTSQISTGSYYAIMDLSGSFSNGILTFTETRIREHLDPPGTYFILKTGSLNYTGTPTQVLEGNWECYDSMTAPCDYAPPGNISVTKGVV